MAAVGENIGSYSENIGLSGPVEAGTPRLGSLLMKPVEVVAALLLVLIIALLLIGVTSRYVFSLPVVWIDEVASFSFLWLAMLGSAIAIDRNEHLRLTIFLGMLPERLQAFVRTFALLVVATFLLVMVQPSVEYVMEEWFVSTPALNVPNSFRVAAIAFGIVAMFAIVVAYAVRTSALRDLVGAAVLIAAVTAAFWLLSPTLLGLGHVNILIFLVGVVAVCLLAGVPIAFCFGIGTLAFLAFSTRVPIFVVVGRMDEGMSSIILLSVPVFVLLGCVLDATGMGKAIVDFLASLLGHVRAGMSYVLLGSLFLVSGISGSKVSDMATVAPALFPEMKRRGNKPEEMAALLGTGAILFILAPPRAPHGL